MPSDPAALPPPAALEAPAVRRLAAELGPFAAGRIDAGRLAEAFARLEAVGLTPGAPTDPGADGTGGAGGGARSGGHAGRLLARLSELDDPAGRLAAWLLQEADRTGADPAGGPTSGGGAPG